MVVSPNKRAEQYQVDASEYGSGQLLKDLMSFEPQWGNYEKTKDKVAVLKPVRLGENMSHMTAMMLGNIDVFGACLAAMTIKEDIKPVQYIVTFLYDLLREDSSAIRVFEEGIKKQLEVYKTLTSVCEGTSDQWVADKVAWIMSTLVGQVPKFFSEEDCAQLVQNLLKGGAVTPLGIVDSIATLLKSAPFRARVWALPGVQDHIFNVQKDDPAPLAYKAVFAIWMVSFDDGLSDSLRAHGAMKRIKDFLVCNRVEKLVRLCLTVLQNCIKHKELCEDIVEEGVLEAVQQLEYEKWRDAELYETIRIVGQQIFAHVVEFSNFERYERELQSGTLTWGFVHTNKFWQENVTKFEDKGDFKAIKTLAALLDSTDPTTVAVACHDLGEFVTLHPFGKKKVVQLGVKERVMQLMSSEKEQDREVRREALLCCQKLMLNKWQDAQDKK